MCDATFYPYMNWHVIVMIVTMASYCVRKGFMMQWFISIGVFMHSTHDEMIFSLLALCSSVVFDRCT
jgi:hypothetical protein